MKRLVAIASVFALLFLGAPSPANAAPCPNETNVDGLGLVCVTANGETATIEVREPATEAPLLSTSVPLPVAAPVTVTVPAPTVEVPGPTRTITVSPSGPRSTATARVPGPTATKTITVTSTPTATSTDTETNAAGGQSGTPRDTLGDRQVTPTLAVPPETPPGSVDLIPDDPKAAAAAGSLFGLFLGIILGIIGLYIAYRRGQLDGEKATLKEFLGVIRGEPATSTGRHRIDE